MKRGDNNMEKLKQLGIIVILTGIVLGLCATGFTQEVNWISTTDSSRWVQKPTSQYVPYDGTSNQLIEVHPDTKYQEIDGFGGCFNELGWDVLSLLTQGERDNIIKKLFDPVTGCKFNICRMPIGASDYALSWYSLNDTPDDYAMNNFNITRDLGCLIPYIKAAMVYKPDLQIWGSPWSPPAWMKKNNDYAGGDNTLKWNSQVLEALALYFAKYVEAYQNEGINVYAVHVQNEPYANQVFPSCLWTGTQMRDFTRDYLGPRFENDNINAEIWLGTINNGNFNACAGVVLANATANAYITGVGYQWAGKGAVLDTHINYPSKRLMQTENECGNGSNDWAAAEYTFSLIKHYLDRWTNSYLYWNMVLDETGRSTWGWKQNSMITVNKTSHEVRYNPEFYVMKHFSYFVQPGAYRISTSGDWSNKLGFLNPNGEIIVVVWNSDNSNRTVTIKIGDDMVHPVVPANSFNTFVLNIEPDYDAPTPDPMTWSWVPHATGPYSISMTATTASDPSGIAYSFECTAGGGHDSDWQDNPTYVDTGLSPETQYTYRVKARDRSSDHNETDWSTEESATTELPPEWTQLTYDDFEAGWGNYTDGGGDCSLYTGGTYAHQGSNAANIQDNSGLASSFYHTDPIDVHMAGYTQIEIDFWFYPRSMESGEDFWVQYYDGSSWHTVASYARGTDFSNGQFYHETVYVSEGTYAFPTNMKIRFQCDATSNYDDVYIDEVKVSGKRGASDTTPPTPDPMTWATVPYATGSTSIAMVATTASDPSSVEYYFACTAGGGNDSDWQDNTTYEDAGLQSETEYTYQVKARDKSPNQNETDWSDAESATTEAEDMTPPSPDPMTWATVPYATGTTSIAMVATTASDPSSVEYYFACTAGGGHDSGWQSSPNYTDTGLSWSTMYTYTVKARDKSPKQNETAASTAKSATTEAEDMTPPSPNPMTWASKPSADSSSAISMTATTASDPSGLEYYFEETSGNPGGSDSGWQNSPNYTDTGLSPSTTYTYTVKARDMYQNETGWSPESSATTDSSSKRFCGAAPMYRDGVVHSSLSATDSLGKAFLPLLLALLSLSLWVVIKRRKKA